MTLDLLIWKKLFLAWTPGFCDLSGLQMASVMQMVSLSSSSSSSSVTLPDAPRLRTPKINGGFPRDRSRPGELARAGHHGLRDEQILSSRYVPPGGGPREDPGHTGRSMT
ncbi:hypothetical protein NQD34_000812 [Periophthalmus magnuspinnatus]|nr:hypothetical protein NQD34_000812 [Periophthalmus magnuspinnatus]